MPDTDVNLWPPADDAEALAIIAELIADRDEHLGRETFEPVDMRNSLWSPLFDRIGIYVRRYWRERHHPLLNVDDVIADIFLIVYEKLDQFYSRHISASALVANDSLSREKPLEAHKVLRPSVRMSFLSWLNIITQHYCSEIGKPGRLTFRSLDEKLKDTDEGIHTLVEQLEGKKLDGEELAQLSLFLEEVWMFLGKSSPLKVTCLLLHVLYQCPQQEIARRLGISRPERVREYINELRRQLRIMRQKYENESVV